MQNLISCLVITATYQGEHIGYSYFEHAILEQEATATPNTEPTSNPATNPTDNPTTTPTQTTTNNPTPTPSVPEFSTMAVLALIITLSLITAIIKSDRRSFNLSVT